VQVAFLAIPEQVHRSILFLIEIIERNSRQFKIILEQNLFIFSFLNRILTKNQRIWQILQLPTWV
jgi:hypothetical protein